MREIIRRTFINSVTLFLVSLFLTGLQITGGFMSFVVAGFLLCVISIILDPIVKIVTLPFNILTLGLLSFLTTLVSLFILTIVYSNVNVTGFTFQGVSLLGLQINQVQVSGFLSYVVISATIYFSTKVVDSIFTK